MKVRPDYNTATNAAYRLLAETAVFSLSTDVFALAASLPNCILLTYGQAVALYQADREVLLEQSVYGFTVLNRRTDARIILYNEEMPLNCIRFTVAHEIAHKVLCHSEEETAWEEKEANCFARNLLCPVPVSDAMNLQTEAEYMDAFNISFQMAVVVVERRSSDAYYIERDLYSAVDEKFYLFMCGHENADAYYLDLYA